MATETARRGRGRPRSTGAVRCDRCGRRVSKTRVTWPDGRICGTCFAQATRTHGSCDECGQQRLLPGRDGRRRLLQKLRGHRYRTGLHPLRSRRRTLPRWGLRPLRACRRPDRPVDTRQRSPATGCRPTPASAVFHPATGEHPHLETEPGRAARPWSTSAAGPSRSITTASTRHSLGGPAIICGSY